MKFEAYWISPRGEILGTDDSHIVYILSNPKKFGVSSEYLKSVHKKYKERLGQEGKAREEIMIQLMKKGWLRARHTDNRGWIIQSYYLNKRDKDNIWNFIRTLSKENEIYKNTSVLVTSIKNSEMLNSSASGILKGAIYEDNEYLECADKILNEDSKIKLKELKYNPSDEYYYQTILFETKLGRIWQYITNEKFTIGIISASRFGFSNKENEKRFSELFKKLPDKYGYTFLNGGFVEGNKTVKEKSILINGISKDELIKLGMEFDQYSVLYKEGKDFFEIGTNDETGIGKILHRYSTNKRNALQMSKKAVKDYFSSMLLGPHANRKFSFSLYERQDASLKRWSPDRTLRWNLVLEEYIFKKNRK